MYSSYYKDHGMKWQAIVTPNGLVSSLCRPYSGPANDWTMVQDSGVLDRCRQVYSDNRRLYIYSDPAYIGAFGIMGPYQHLGGRHALPLNEHQFNVALSSVRISVEHAFGHVMKQWGFTAFSEGLSEGLSPVATYFTTAVLFTNCLTCFRGSQTSQRFGVEPLSIYEYCSGVRWPAPEKSPDLGNSSPASRALMYVASLQTSGRYHHHGEDRGLTDEDRNWKTETKAGWLRSELKAWSDYWTFTDEH
jgi:hypothetical protein